MGLADEHLRYLGCVALLAEAYQHVPTDLQHRIEMALGDASAAVHSLHVHCLEGRSMTVEIDTRNE